VNGYVIVDASLAIKWVLNEPYADKALAIAGEWATAGIRPVAPCLLLIEATNVLHRRVVKGHISSSQAMQLLAGFLNMGIEVRESPQIHLRALELAEELQMPAVYDTHYLALADIMECDLWTADERFFNSVKERQPRVKWLGEFEAEK
jgi:predicted nucleic acid-binding protein